MIIGETVLELYDAWEREILLFGPIMDRPEDIVEEFLLYEVAINIHKYGKEIDEARLFLTNYQRIFEINYGKKDEMTEVLLSIESDEVFATLFGHTTYLYTVD